MHKADLGSQFADTIKLGFSAPSLRSERQQIHRAVSSGSRSVPLLDASLPQASRIVIYNSKAVGCQFQKYDLGNVGALFRLNPLVVQILTAVTLGVFDKRLVDGAN